MVIYTHAGGLLGVPIFSTLKMENKYLIKQMPASHHSESHYPHDGNSLQFPEAAVRRVTSFDGSVTSALGPMAMVPEVARQPFRRIDSFSKARGIILLFCILAGLLFSSLDAGIVATSMHKITEELGDSENVSWIILAYLLTYMGFAVVLSRLSDIFGRKDVLLISWMVFLSFSLGCATSKTMTQLIICRAFQGVGGSGLYALSQVALAEMGPVDKPGMIGAMVGVTLACSLILGPILGGLISHLSTWKWIFYLNVPCSALTIVLIALSWPPYQDERGADIQRYSWKSVLSIDFLGSSTLLCTCCFLVVAIQQAGVATAAQGASSVIVALAIAAGSGIAFISWQVALSRGLFRNVKSVLPAKLFSKRVFAASFLVTLLTGFPYLALMVIVPERFQVVNGDNILVAGVKLLPLLGACAVGSFAAGAVSSRRNNTSYTLVLSAILQLVGTGLMTTIDDPNSSVKALYAYLSIVGFGVGLCFGAATISTSLQVPTEYLATAHGAVSQARLLGGCLGISICTVILNYRNGLLSDGRLEGKRLEMAHSNFTEAQGQTTLGGEKAQVYSAAFGVNAKIMMYLCTVMFLASLFTLERNPANMSTLMDHQKSKFVADRESHSSSGIEPSDLSGLR